MQPLITITSCRRDQVAGCHQAIRETWGKNCPIDYRFILGEGNEVMAPDELVFDVPDGYSHVSHKTWASHKWAVENGYGHVLQAFTDTYLNIRAILSSDYANYDYTGLFRGLVGTDADLAKPDHLNRYGYASGGVGYWTSRRANEVLAANRVFDDELMEWAEDLWTGAILGRHGIYGHSDPRYRLEAQDYINYVRQRRLAPREVFSLHLGRGTGVYDTAWMHEAYQVIGA